jgi:hypothetical protein
MDTTEQPRGHVTCVICGANGNRTNSAVGWEGSEIIEVDLSREFE